MIEENKYTVGLRLKFNYDFDDNCCLFTCEKEQSVNIYRDIKKEGKL